MNKKITFFARGAKCVGRVVNGSRCASLLAGDCSASMAASAIEPKPLAQRASMSRRESGAAAKLLQWDMIESPLKFLLPAQARPAS